MSLSVHGSPGHGFTVLAVTLRSPSQRGLPEGSPGAAGPGAHSSLHFFCSHEQSNDELVTEILSDMMKRVPLSVEKEECTGMPNTLKSIMSSPIWDSLYKSINGKHVPWVPSPRCHLLGEGKLASGGRWSREDERSHRGKEAEGA